MSTQKTIPARKRPAAPSRGTSFLRQRRRGSALVISVMFITIFSMVVGYVMQASNRQTRNTYRSRLFSTSLAAAATVVKSMRQQAYFIATTRPEQLQGKWSNLNEAILSIKPETLPGYITATDGADNLTFFRAKSDGNGNEEIITDPADDWSGFKIRRWSYEAVAFLNAGVDPDDPANTVPTAVDPTATHLGFEGAGFRSTVEINYIPLYQYAIFYDNDLELHTGPNMDVEGPVHSNRNLWLATKANLNFKDKVTAAGDFRTYRDFVGVDGSLIDPLNSDIVYAGDGNDARIEITDHAGNVTIENRKTGDQVQVNNNISDALDTNKNTFLDSLDTNWLTDAIERLAGNLQDSAMGVKPIRPPLPYIEDAAGDRVQADAADLIQRADPANDSESMKDNKMEYQADYVIEGDPTKVKEVGTGSDKHLELTDITIKDSNGNIIPNTVDGESIVTPGSFYDNRQKQTDSTSKLVNTFDVDMGEIINRGLVFENGLLYVSPVGGEMGSVRVTNADTVPTSAKNTFTVASDRPMYLEGDINSDSNATLLLAADAITITSQELTVENTAGNNIPDAQGAVETNAIFMLGQVGSKYQDPVTGEIFDHYVPGSERITMSGGAHNVLRYLEDWGGVKHTYNGSLICLFESRVATSDFWRMDKNSSGNWKHKNYYNAPVRSYNWDPDLQDSEPPAGMPVLVEVKMWPLERISKAEAVAMLD